MTKRKIEPVEDPAKLKAEDYVNRGLRAAISALPVLGGPLLELFTFAVAEPSQERRDDFLKSLFERIVDLENQYSELKPENLKENAAFQTTCIQAVQAAMRTNDSVKRIALKNAVINSALAGDLDETIRQIFMNLIDRMPPLEIALLSFLDNPKKDRRVAEKLENLSMGGLVHIVGIAIPQLAGQTDLAQVLGRDLEATGLVSGAALNVTMTGHGLGERRTTELGRSFIRFISEPSN